MVFVFVIDHQKVHLRAPIRAKREGFMDFSAIPEMMAGMFGSLGKGISSMLGYSQTIGHQWVVHSALLLLLQFNSGWQIQITVEPLLMTFLFQDVSKLLPWPFNYIHHQASGGQHDLHKGRAQAQRHLRLMEANPDVTAIKWVFLYPVTLLFGMDQSQYPSSNIFWEITYNIWTTHVSK